MTSRYKIVLTSAFPDCNIQKSVSRLVSLTGASRDEVEFWVRNLPHTLSQSAAEDHSRRLLKEFTALGFKVETIPPLPSLIQAMPQSVSPQSTETISIPSIKSSRSRSVSLSIFIIIMLVVVFFFSLFSAYWIMKKYVRPGREDVEQLLKNGRYGQAQAVLSEEMGRDGGTAEDHLKRAIARISRIRQTGQRNNWKRHLVSGGWDDDLNTLTNYYKTEEGDAALKDLLSARELSPENPDIEKWLGILYQERRDLKKAEASFLNVLKQSPGNVEVLNYLGTLKIDQRDFSGADGYFKKALRLEPDSPECRKNMGLFQLFYLHDTLKAISSLLKYMRLETRMDFERPVIREQVTQLLWSRYFPAGQSKESGSKMPFPQFETRRKKLMSELREKKTADLYQKLGKLFFAQGMFQEAMMHWSSALRIDPSLQETAHDLFRLQGSLGLFPQAKGTLEAAVEQKSPPPQMFMALGLLNKYYVENRKNAIINFEKYLKLQDNTLRREAILELQELNEK